MEWNWLGNQNDLTTFWLSESTGDSEEVKSQVHHNLEHDEASMDEFGGVSFRFNDDNDDDDDDDDDDAQSCSYDHSSYISTRCGNSPHDQSQRLIYDDDDDDDDDGEVDDDDDGDEDKNKNLCETRLMDSSKQEWRCHKSCGDPSSNQREIDRKFWEACLAS